MSRATAADLFAESIPCGNDRTGEVLVDKDWLYIITDDYEGTSMFLLKDVPELMRVLRMAAKLAKALQAKETP